MYELNNFPAERNYCLNDLLDFDGENLDDYCFELLDAEEKNDDQDEDNERLKVEQGDKMYV